MIFTLLLTLLSVTANAQTLEGMYKADKEFEEMANSYVEKILEGKQLDFDADYNVGMSLFFMGDSLTDLIIEVNAQVEKVNVEARVTFPGTYKRDGNHISCTYDKDRMNVAVMKITSFDPDISEMLKSDEDMVYGVAEEKLQEVVEPYTDKLYKACKFFKSYDILEQTESSLRIRLEEGLELNFNRPI